MHLPLSSTLSNNEIAEIFSFISQVLNLDPKNQYRARAYEEAGVVIHQLDYELAPEFAHLQSISPDTVVESFAKQLDALPGIGESITKKLIELFTTGNILSFQKYVKDLPAGIFPLVQLSGIGVKKAKVLAEAFHLDDPKTAIEIVLTKAKQEQVRTLPGFGEKSEQDLIDILQQKYRKSRIPYKEALVVAENIKTALEKSGQVTKVTFLGSLRRKAQTVGDIDLGAVVEHVDQLKEQLNSLSFIKKVLIAGDNMIRVILENNWQVDIKLSSPDEWGSFLQHFTGSKEHNIRLREYAIKKGLSLSEHGIKIAKTNEVKKFTTEEEFYRFLGLKYIPPEERIGGQEIEQYQASA